MSLFKKEHPIKHVAIIMDGNGRWAKMRSRPRVWGHVRGSGIVSEIVEEADLLGIKALTLYAFSTENWSRPEAEVRVLFNLLHKFLRREQEKIIKNKIRFKIMGDTSNLPLQVRNLISELEMKTAMNSGLKLTFAFGYGGRAEITSAVNKVIKKKLSEKVAIEITEEDLGNNLLIPDLGDVDLLIRTGGDFRISNFLLWQIAYAELYFSETKWPEFTRIEFRKILETVSMRERRFGAITSSIDLKTTCEQARLNKEILKKQE